MANPSASSLSPRPLPVEILTYAPTQFFHCQHCEFIWHEAGAGAAFHQEQLASSMPEELQAEYLALSRWVREMASLYGARVQFRIVDAASVEGLYKSVRHGARRYPAFIIGGRTRVSGPAFALVQTEINRELAREGVSGAQASPTA